jgi:hypothetical protein
VRAAHPITLDNPSTAIIISNAERDALAAVIFPTPARASAAPTTARVSGHLHQIA